jgi:hypothetical protein
MLKTLALVLSLSVMVGVAAQAQTVRTPTAAAVEPQMADMSKWQTAMVAAQAAAMKPGDEALPCEALHKELVTSMNDPSLQAYAAKTNPALAKEFAAREKKNSAMAPEAAAAMAAALASPMAMTGMPVVPTVAGQQMTPQQMQQMMLAQQQASIAYMNQMAPIMPVLMRSQRVTQLAAVKNCAWITGGVGLYPGVAPRAVPGAVQSR